MESRHMRMLVTTIGDMGGYSDLTYSRHDEASSTWTGKIGGVATAICFGPIDQMVVFGTEATSKWFQEVRRVCTENSLPNPVCRVIPSGASEDEQWGVIDAVIDGITDTAGEAESVSLILDITHGYRSLPFLYFTAISFLTTFRRFQLEHTVYSSVNFKEGKATILDVTSAFTTIEWFNAASSFVKTGEVASLLKLIERKKERLRHEGKDYSEVNLIRKGLNATAGYFNAALPLELGLKSNYLSRNLSFLEESPKDIPLFRHLIEEVRESSDTFATHEAGQKAKIALTKQELERQLRIIEKSLHHELAGNTLTMLREYVINSIAFHVCPTNWLDYSHRSDIAQTLNALSKISQDESLASNVKESQLEIGRLWDQIALSRNQMAHCGYTHDEISLNTIKSRTRELISLAKGMNYSSVMFRGNTKCKVLVCSLGKSKGAMYSAIKHTHPDRIIAITSPETVEFLDEVLQATECKETPVVNVCIGDPHRSFNQIPELVHPHKIEIMHGSTIDVHIVGGTTMMSELARAFGHEARKLGVPYTIFATVDSRPYEEQMENPFEIGEYIELERWPEMRGDL